MHKQNILLSFSFDVLSKAQSKVRIKVCNYLIGITLLTCFVASILGKKRAQKGETISKLIMERDKKFVEEYKREQELKSKEVN